MSEVLNLNKKSQLLQERMDKFKDIDLYPVTCELLSNNRSNIDILNGIIEGGARIIQLREKHYSKQKLYNTALEFRKITIKNDVLLIINDHLDIALAVGADGVHLGQEDLPLLAACKIAPDMIIGISTHSVDQAIAAEKEGAGYINIGPIFPTQTKEHTEALTEKIIPDIISNISIPFTVMGGINQENINRVIQQGAKRIAMVTGITQASDIASRVRSLRNMINNGLN